MTDKEVEKTPQNKFLSWLDPLSKVVGLVAGLSLAGSLAYDWAYFYALGLSFSDVPTSITDHMRSTLNWIPLATLSVFIIIVLELFFKRSEKNMTEEQLIKTSPYPKFTAWFRKSPTYVIIFFSLLNLILYILFGYPFSQGLNLTFFVLWFFFCWWVNSYPRTVEKRSKELRFAIYWLPPAIVWIAFMGYAAGSASWNTNVKSSYSTIYFKNTTDPIQVRCIRLFEKGIVFKKTHDLSVIFVRWEEVLKIEKSTDKPWEGILKNWFGIPKEKNDTKKVKK